MKTNFITLVYIVICSSFVHAQENITGLWEVVNVSVGENTMTPVARWSRINADGSLETGNGWTKNASGTWAYDLSTHEFHPENPLGLKDPAGPFKVEVKGDTMIWERTEEGMFVRVINKRIDELPMAPADLLHGMWDLVKVSKNEKDITASYDPDGKKYTYFGWDRIYRGRDVEGNRETGFWHINAHRPEVTIMPHREGATPVTWQISVNEDSLVMNGVSDSNKNQELKFVRRDEYPK